MPITRPLWLAYPNDPRPRSRIRSGSSGPDVLVAPVVTQGATSRPVYFPAWCWARPDTGVRYIGPSTATIPAALAELPYFFHCGTQPFAVSSPSCPAASGRVSGLTLGRLHLGETRRSVRRVFTRVRTRHLHFMDFFCLTGNGVRAGYPSPHLLRTLPRMQRRRVRGRVVLLLSANRHYALEGIRPGARLSAVMRHRRRSRRVRVGLNTWYLLARSPAPGVLKVVHGRVQEIGLADPRLTRTLRTTQRLFHSFS